MKRVLRFLLYLLSIIPLLILTLVLILQVPAVNQWALNKAIDLTPGLEVQKIQGQLFHKLTLNGISYQSDAIKLSVDHFSSKFSAQALFIGTVQFDSVDISGINLKIFDQEPRAEEDESGSFAFPVALNLELIKFSDMVVSTNEQSWQIEKVMASLHGFGQTINIKELHVQLASAQIDLQGDIELSENLPFNLHIAAQGSVQELGDVQGTIKLAGDKNRIDFIQTITVPFELATSGSVLLETEKPQLTLQGGWRNLYWPLQGAARYASNQGELVITGIIDDYRLRVNGDIHGLDIPQSNFDLQAKGSTELMQIMALDIDTLNGRIQGKGQLDWQEDFNWMMQLNAAHLNPDVLFPDYPGDITFDALLSGNTRDKLTAIVEVNNLQGTLQDHALSGKGKVSYFGETIAVDHLQLQLGENLLLADGSMGKKSSLDVMLDANNLSQLYAGVSGRMKATGTVTGDYQHPAVVVQIDAQLIGFEQYQLKQANINGILDFADQGMLDMSGEAMQIKINETLLDKVTLKLGGNFSAHTVETFVTSEQGELRLAVEGSYEQKKQHWDGRISDLRIMKSQLGDWIMKKNTPIKITLKNDQIKISNPDLCLRNTASGGEACIMTAWSKQQGQQLAGHIKNLPLNAFSHWLPQNIQLDSQLAAQFDLTMGSTLNGELFINTEAGLARLSSDNQMYQMPLKRSGLQAKLVNDQLQTQFGVNFNDQDNISGDISIADVSNSEEAEVNGKIAVNIADLGFLNALTTTINEIQGKLGVELTVQGPLADPMLTAMNGSLQDTGFSMPDAGISVNDINIKAVQGDMRTLLKGNADIGGKALLLDGWIQKDASGLASLDIKLQGEQLKVVQLANAEIWADPDLHLLLDPQGLLLKGEIGIPKADVTIEELPEGAVTVSKDEVIITHGEPIEIAQPFNFKAKVLIKLGKEVAIQGHGLKTRLEGDLLAVYEKNRFMLYNELELMDGVYQSFGQDLTIEKGKLLFTGAVDNPGINLLAYRESTEWEDKVVAYLQLTGTLNDTETKVYTKPALSESESLAYLLTGAPLDQASGSNSEMLAKAALSYGKDYIDGVMAVIGIDEFDVKSTQVGSTSMVLGKRITPKLFVRYIMDVLTSRMLFAVEYKFTDQISIETRAGDTHSSDIKYSIEFD